LIGAVIALLCLAAFVPTYLFDHKSFDRAAFEDFTTYYRQHPYLELPRQLRDQDVRGQLLEGTDELPPPLPDVKRSEQAELDRRWNALMDASGGLSRRFALVPSRGVAQPGWLTSMFLHGGWMHLLFNLLFLYIVAPLLEDAWGRPRFLLFYLLGGLFAGGAEFALERGSSVGIIGASGAIAACMGAFAVRFAARKIQTLYVGWFIRPFFGTVNVAAWLLGVAWFIFELKDLALGGAEGVATGAHVAGFAMGATVALGMKALGFEKTLRTTEEANLETSHMSTLMQDASVGFARGDYGGARASLTELVKLMPGREDAELLLAQIDLREHRGAARLERYLRKLMAAHRDGELFSTLLPLTTELDVTQLTPPFALELARKLRPSRNHHLIELVEPLLKHAASSGGRVATQAQADLAAHQGSSGLGDVAGWTAPGPAARTAADRGPNAAVRNEASQGIAELMGETGDSPPIGDSPLPGAAAISHAARGLSGQTVPAQIFPATFAAVTAQGLTLHIGGTERLVAFATVRAVHAAIAPIDGRRVLFVDLVLQLPEAGVAPRAVRLTSDDAAVAALFPQMKMAEGWNAFVNKVVSISRAKRLPEGAAGFPGFPSTDALTASWASISGRSGV
jgi:membrane associated rhomboid family serine protease